MSPQFLTLAAFSLLLAATPAIAAEKVEGKIKKCQDATGRWHYGDTAAAGCAKSKVEVLSDTGVKTKEIAAPPTEAELADRELRKDDIEREKRAAEDQVKRDKILQSTYGHEDDIALVRDRKLAQLEAQIKASEETVKSLRAVLGRMETDKQTDEQKNDVKALAQTEKSITQTKSQIQRHEASIVQRRQEQEQVRKQYTSDLERYREMKARTPTATPAPKQ